PPTLGGEGRLAVAADRSDVRPLLQAEHMTVVVEPRGTRREFEAISLLRRAGHQIRRLTVGEDGQLAGKTLAGSNVRSAYDVEILARRDGGDWQVAPAGDTHFETGDELVVAGRPDALSTFEGVIA
ncbi:MAG: potassium channel family protein, partial [Halodesulfurarchaeum sp.]